MRRTTSILALSLLLLLAACGTGSSGGTGSTSGGTTTTTGPTTLHVVRSNTLYLHFPPFDHTISTAVAVQKLFHAALALPKVAGVYNCPVDTGLEYHLTFLHGTSSIQQMNLDASGCQFLGIGKQDSRVTNAAFLALFTKTVGITSLYP